MDQYKNPQGDLKFQYNDRAHNKLEVPLVKILQDMSVYPWLLYIVLKLSNRIGIEKIILLIFNTHVI